MGIEVDISCGGSFNSAGTYNNRAASKVEIRADLYYSRSSKGGLYNYRATSKAEGGAGKANNNRNNNERL